jgi:demethylmenaquinone methyltransferase/2-methoxy-6-polyprenyl-1,4-benzoquinol methylase
MFARISGRYDLLNRLLSLGIDRRWRAALIACAGNARGGCVVDVCCGTGDVALLFAQEGARVVGIDFTGEMLHFAQRKLRDRGAAGAERLAFIRGDAMALPLASGTAGLVTIAFGIRNVADRSACLREIARVLQPGGRLVILEFGSPPNRRTAAVYGIYFRTILPRIGSLLSGDREAYRYLADSVAAWPGPVDFQREMERAGFGDCHHRSLSGGIAYLHWGTAPPKQDLRSGLAGGSACE